MDGRLHGLPALYEPPLADLMSPASRAAMALLPPLPTVNSPLPRVSTPIDLSLDLPPLTIDDGLDPLVPIETSPETPLGLPNLQRADELPKIDTSNRKAGGALFRQKLATLNNPGVTTTVTVTKATVNRQLVTPGQQPLPLRTPAKSYGVLPVNPNESFGLTPTSIRSVTTPSAPTSSYGLRTPAPSIRSPSIRSPSIQSPTSLGIKSTTQPGGLSPSSFAGGSPRASPSGSPATSPNARVPFGGLFSPRPSQVGSPMGSSPMGSSPSEMRSPARPVGSPVGSPRSMGCHPYGLPSAINPLERSASKWAYYSEYSSATPHLAYVGGVDNSGRIALKPDDDPTVRTPMPRGDSLRHRPAEILPEREYNLVFTNFGIRREDGDYYQDTKFVREVSDAVRAVSIARRRDNDLMILPRGVGGLVTPEIFSQCLTVYENNQVYYQQQTIRQGRTLMSFQDELTDLEMWFLNIIEPVPTDRDDWMSWATRMRGKTNDQYSGYCDPEILPVLGPIPMALYQACEKWNLHFRL